MWVIAMIGKIKNSIITFNAIDNQKKHFWKKVIYMTAFIISIVALSSIILVYLGVLPNAVHDTLCSWYTPFTRGQLGDVCN